MARLIDADAACEKCRNRNCGTCGCCIIGTATAVDAQPVVRCGHCIHRKVTQKANKMFGWNCTNKWSPCRGRIVNDSDYCPYGERENNG